MKFQPDDLTEFRWLRPSGGFRWVSARPAIGLPPSEEGEPGRFLISVVPPDSPQRALAYSPLSSHTGLFKRFAEVKPDEDSILAFANDYGLLGGTVNTAVQIDGEPSLRVQAEAFDAWTMEIKELGTLVDLWEAARDRPKALADRIHWDGDAVYFATADSSSYALIASSAHNADALALFPRGDLAAPAMHLIARRVNRQMEIHGAGPKLLFDADGRLVIRLSPGSLIAALWLQFARAVEGDKTYKQCQNCRNWVEVGGNRSARSDKKFCTPSCKSAFHRKRSAEGKEE